MSHFIYETFSNIAILSIKFILIIQETFMFVYTHAYYFSKGYSLVLGYAAKLEVASGNV